MLTISLRLSTSGGWNVCQEGVALFSDMPLKQAAGLAMVVASEEQQRLLGPTCVEMPGTRGKIVLARYAQLEAGRPRHSGMP